jgi:protein-tyrosine phosphatase
MTATNLYWVDGPWTGKLALAARPRGGEWLEDEIANWVREGVDAVLSLLTVEEEQELDVGNEAAQAKAHGVEFLSFPIADRQVPSSEDNLTRLLEQVDRKLSSGKSVLMHCRQGIGRVGLVAACLLLTKGLNAEMALNRLAAARGVPLPETPEQRRWIDHYAATLATAKMTEQPPLKFIHSEETRPD